MKLKNVKNILKSKEYRKRKEFYQIDLDILKQLTRSCEKLSIKVRMPPKKKSQQEVAILL